MLTCEVVITVRDVSVASVYDLLVRRHTCEKGGGEKERKKTKERAGDRIVVLTVDLPSTFS